VGSAPLFDVGVLAIDVGFAALGDPVPVAESFDTGGALVAIFEVDLVAAVAFPTFCEQCRRPQQKGTTYR
jgi:hypothetical protein